MGAAEDAFQRRRNWLERTGTVGIRNFDEGVVVTLGATVWEVGSAPNADGKYYVTVPGVCGPPGTPGVPIVFANPEDVTQDNKVPYILVRRDDLVSSMDRWQPAATQYRAPGNGAVPFIATSPTGLSAMGFDRMEMLEQAIPYDIMYTISIKARYRGAPGQRNQVNGLLQHTLRVYPPYGRINVVDSIGDNRGYEAFNEGITNIDNLGEVNDRELGFAITLRVEGELDLKDPVTIQTVKRPLTLRTRQL